MDFSRVLVTGRYYRITPLTVTTYIPLVGPGYAKLRNNDKLSGCKLPNTKDDGFKQDLGNGWMVDGGGMNWLVHHVFLGVTSPLLGNVLKLV